MYADEGMVWRSHGDVFEMWICNALPQLSAALGGEGQCRKSEQARKTFKGLPLKEGGVVTCVCIVASVLAILHWEFDAQLNKKYDEASARPQTLV
jgi:hypothetical protein